VGFADSIEKGTLPTGVTLRDIVSVTLPVLLTLMGKKVFVPSVAVTLSLVNALKPRFTELQFIDSAVTDL
jgi:hypothetical protein